MKKRLLSMLMAVLMIVSLVPAVSADVDHTNHDKFSYSVAKDVAAKQPGIELVVCNVDGAVLKATVVPFAEKADIQKCAKNDHNWKSVELQKASCEVVGITLTYCADCGTAKKVDATGSAAGSVTIDKVKTHVYTDFKVVVEPTCNKEGWGYVVCDNCKNPLFIGGVSDAQKAVALVGEGKYTAALYKNVTALYAKVNENHTDKDAFVTVTEDVYENGKLVFKAPVKGVHDYSTVGRQALMAWEIVVGANGKAVIKSYDVDCRANDGKYVRGTNEYTGDKYCPFCYEAGEEMKNGDNFIKGTYKGSLWTQHKASFELKEAGYYPYVDAAGDKHDGKTDLYWCGDCKAYFGGEVLPFDEYVDLNDITKVGATWTAPAVAATCTDVGATAAVWTYSKATASANAEWVITTASEEIPALGHHYAKVADIAPTCTKSGLEFDNVYACDRVVNPLTGEKCNAVKPGSDPNQVRKIDPLHATATAFAYKQLVAPTCTTKGLSVKMCGTCGAYALNEQAEEPVYYYVPAVDCVAGDPVGAKDATCTEVGATGDTFCKWCNTKLSSSKEIPMVDHTAVDVEAVAATCTEAGATAGTKCSVCGEVLSGCEVVNALGHKFEKGFCTVCEAADPDYVAPVAPEFTDAKDIAPYAGDAVAWAVANGIVNGRDDGSFDPKANVTRADLVVMLWRQAGEPESTAKVEFTDAADIPEYAVKAVAWAVEKGIVSGYEDNSFKPTADVTRAELVKMLYVMVGTKVETAADFSDVVAGEWYVDAINWAVENEVTTGRDNGTFGVADNATREEAVTFLFRAFAE